MDLSNQHCRVYDNGLFVSTAIELSKYFGKVSYCTPWNSSGFPKSNARLIGQGIPEIEWIEDVFNDIKSVDTFCFPDCYAGPLQVHIADDLGIPVWGSKRGDEIELLREDAKKHFKTLGLPIGKYEVIYGLDKLREYLKSHNNQWVKIETTRGDMETFHAKNYRLIEPKLDELEHNLGALKYILKFIVEDSIDDAVETGIDTFAVDDLLPATAMVGLEIKDKGYLAKIRKYANLPSAITQFPEAIRNTLAAYTYRNFYSTENRVTKDGTSFMNDFCSRQGSPPSELYLKMIKNLGPIVHFGARGELVEPEWSDVYGAEVLIQSSWADKNWQAIDYPEELNENVVLRNMTIIEGKRYALPQLVGIPEIGAVIATGKTKEEAVNKVKKCCEKVEGYYIETFCDSLDTAAEELEKLKSFNIDLFAEDKN
jgi:hypothetical protein